LYNNIERLRAALGIENPAYAHSAENFIYSLQEFLAPFILPSFLSNVKRKGGRMKRRNSTRNSTEENRPISISACAIDSPSRSLTPSASGAASGRALFILAQYGGVRRA